MKTAKTWRDLRDGLDREDYMMLIGYCRWCAEEDLAEYDDDEKAVGPFFRKDGGLRRLPRLDALFDWERVVNSDFYIDHLISDPGEWMLRVLPEEVISLGTIELSDSPSSVDRFSIDAEHISEVLLAFSKLGLSVYRDDQIYASML